jgi:hypothetical protein
MSMVYLIMGVNYLNPNWSQRTQTLNELSLIVALILLILAVSAILVRWAILTDMGHNRRCFKAEQKGNLLRQGRQLRPELPERDKKEIEHIRGKLKE